MDKRSARPEPEIRFYVDGRQTDDQGFWQAVKELGGQAVVTTQAPEPPEPRYTLTAKGRAALAAEEAAG